MMGFERPVGLLIDSSLRAAAQPTRGNPVEDPQVVSWIASSLRFSQ
jgi:hypothetical protein